LSAFAAEANSDNGHLDVGSVLDALGVGEDGSDKAPVLHDVPQLDDTTITETLEGKKKMRERNMSAEERKTLEHKRQRELAAEQGGKKPVAHQHVEIKKQADGEASSSSSDDAEQAAQITAEDQAAYQPASAPQTKDLNDINIGSSDAEATTTDGDSDEGSDDSA